DFWRRPADSSNSVDNVATSNIVPPGAWTHVVAVYGASGAGGGSMRVYVDGVLAASSVTTGNYVPAQLEGGPSLTMTRLGASELYAPGGTGGSAPRFAYDGSIDEVMIFDRSLTAEEVLALYQNVGNYVR